MTLIIFPILVAAGLIMPGWLVARALRCQAGLLGYFLISAAMFFNVLLVLDATVGRFESTTLLTTYAVLNLSLFLLGCRASRLAPAAKGPGLRRKAQHFHWLLIPAGLGLMAISARAIYAPLSGFDTVFRWGHLADEMFLRGNIDFYPPISANDFLKYPWCDGIAPIISSLYYWTYLSLGSVNQGATSIIVIGQALLLYYSVYALANIRGGTAAGCAAVALLSSSPVLLWGVAMGQETGMTALCLVAMFYYIEKYRRSGTGTWLIMAGIAAGVGGLAREYGLVFFALGACSLVPLRITPIAWIKFVGTSLLVMSPWYLRNWFRTGNPLYCHDIIGLFPVNQVHTDYIRTTGEVFLRAHLINTSLTWLFLGGLPLVAGFLCIAIKGRSCAAWGIAVFAIIILWVWSVGQTSGGSLYSLRVLTPAIALLASLGGILLSAPTTIKYGAALAAILLVPAVDAAQRSLYMPINAKVCWWDEPPFGWREQWKQAEQWESLKSWDLVVDAVENRAILVNDPGVWAMLHHRGARITPIFSPQVRFLFESDAKLEPSIRQLRAAGFRFILLSRVDYVSNVQLARAPFFRALNAVSPTANLPFGDIYDLYAPDFLSTVSPKSPSTRP